MTAPAVNSSPSDRPSSVSNLALSVHCVGTNLVSISMFSMTTFALQRLKFTEVTPTNSLA